MTTERISPEFTYSSHFVNVLGSKMHYIEQGHGDPILFLHGIPTSSYLWRNIIPYLAPLARCIAADLIGMGQSDKPNIEYTIADHIRYMDKFIESLQLKNITLVMHGWGSIIGLDYAMRHEKNCKALVFYEAFLRPLNGNPVSLPFQEQLGELEDMTEAADVAANPTNFIEQIIAQGVMRPLTKIELNYYRAPFQTAGSAKPLQQYLNELTDEHGKAAIDKVIAHYSKKLTQSKLPKLMLYSVPGFITTIATALWARDHLPNLTIVDIGEELHYAQESHPQLMGESISAWLQALV